MSRSISSGQNASVPAAPYYSPLRYPGGKTWLAPTLRERYKEQKKPFDVFVEPFAGGAIMSLMAVIENFAKQAVICECDPEIARLWRAILETPEKLIEKIGNFEPTRDSVDKLLAENNDNVLDAAFRTFVRNRVNRGGILAAGASMIREGENGKGVASRWYSETLIKRIEKIGSIANRIDFFEGDGLALLRRFKGGKKTAYFIDPPYTAGGARAGRRLYSRHQIDHEELFRVVSELRGDFLMTYDDAPEPRKLAKERGFRIKGIKMKSAHHQSKTELLITRGEKSS